MDGTILPGATDSTYTVSENGIYSVVVRDQRDCRDSTGHQVSNVTAIPNISDIGRSITVYPNPAKDRVHFYSPIPVAVTLGGIDGRQLRATMLMKNYGSMDISGIEPGIYLLCITDERGHLLNVEKLLKKE